jgi:hypothetical protein
MNNHDMCLGHEDPGPSHLMQSSGFSGLQFHSLTSHGRLNFTDPANTGIFGGGQYGYQADSSKH